MMNAKITFNTFEDKYTSNSCLAIRSASNTLAFSASTAVITFAGVAEAPEEEEGAPEELEGTAAELLLLPEEEEGASPLSCAEASCFFAFSFSLRFWLSLYMEGNI